MECMYAALLLHKAKQPISEENMKKVLTAAGVNADTGRIKAVVAALEGVNIDDIIAKASVSTIAATPVTVATGTTQAAAKPEKSAEDEKRKEEEAAAGLGALFG